MSQPPQVNRATKPPEFYAQQQQFFANGSDPANDWWALQTQRNDNYLDDSAPPALPARGQPDNPVFTQTIELPPPLPPKNAQSTNYAPNPSPYQVDNGRSRSHTVGGPASYSNNLSAPQLQPAQPKKKVIRLAGGGVLEVDDYSSGPSVISNYPPQNSAPPPRPQTTNYGQAVNYNNYKQYVAPSPVGLAPPPINRQSKIITAPPQYDTQFNQYNNGVQQSVQPFQPNTSAPSLPSKATQPNYAVGDASNLNYPRAESAPTLPNQPKQFPKQPPKNPMGAGPKKIQIPKQPVPNAQLSPNQYNPSPNGNNLSPVNSPNYQPVPVNASPFNNQPGPVQPNYPNQAHPKQPIVNTQPQSLPPSQPVQLPSVAPPQQIVISEPDDEPQTSPEPGGKRPLTLGELYKLKNQAKTQRRDTSPQRTSPVRSDDEDKKKQEDLKRQEAAKMEEARRAEELRLLELKRLEEEQKKLEEFKRQEALRLEEERRKVEEERLRVEELRRLQEQQQRLEEQRKFEEMKRVEEERKRLELARLEEERRLLELEKQRELERIQLEQYLAEQKRIAAQQALEEERLLEEEMRRTEELKAQLAALAAERERVNVEHQKLHNEEVAISENISQHSNKPVEQEVTQPETVVSQPPQPEPQQPKVSSPGAKKMMRPKGPAPVPGKVALGNNQPRVVIPKSQPPKQPVGSEPRTVVPKQAPKQSVPVDSEPRTVTPKAQPTTAPARPPTTVMSNPVNANTSEPRVVTPKQPAAPPKRPPTTMMTAPQPSNNSTVDVNEPRVIVPSKPPLPSKPLVTEASQPTNTEQNSDSNESAENGKKSKKKEKEKEKEKNKKKDKESKESTKELKNDYIPSTTRERAKTVGSPEDTKFTRAEYMNFLGNHFLTTTLGYIDPANESFWKIMLNKQGLVICRRKFKELPKHVIAYRAETTIGAPIEKVLSFIMDLSWRPNWNYNLMEGKVVEQLDEFRTEHWNFKRNRDIVAATRVLRYPNGSILFIARSVSYVKTDLKLTGTKLNLYFQLIIMEPDNDRTHFRFVEMIDYKGSSAQSSKMKALSIFKRIELLDGLCQYYRLVDLENIKDDEKQQQREDTQKQREKLGEKVDDD